MSSEVENSNELNNNNNNHIKSNGLFNKNYSLNNEDYKNESMSSVSSYQSDSSDEVPKILPRRLSAQDFGFQELDDCNHELNVKRNRSMSDGSAIQIQRDEEPFEVFPGLPDSVLEKMGLRGAGDGPRKRLNEEESEQKFTSLALAISIDSATIKDRCERQRRSRNQTELNLRKEIEKLIEKVHRMQPMCVDFETTELLSALLTQIDIVMRASSLAATSAEKYGAVQVEERLTDSVNLMISHVDLLKQQRDHARNTRTQKQKSLQETNTITYTTFNKIKAAPKEKCLGKRRASIASCIQTSTEPHEIFKIEKRLITRRTSDLSVRASSLSKNFRPSRLELGVELLKIKEGIVENEPVQTSQPNIEENESEDESMKIVNNNNYIDTITSSPPPPSMDSLPNSNRTIRDKFMYRWQRVKNSAEEKLQKWTNTGVLHETLCFCAVVCFSISLLIMTNIIIEFELSKRGYTTDLSYFFWYWSDSDSSSKKIDLIKR